MVGEKVGYNPITDNSYYDSYVASTELSTFLSRPVECDTQIWADGSTIVATIKPWETFFNNTAIKNKLQNYAYVSCNLKIKIMVNASPFYYGAALYSYYPREYINPGAMDASIGDQLAIPQSQRPHVWVYPQTSSGGEMTLPFFYEKNWLRVTEYDDFNRMGDVLVRTPVALQNVGTNTTGITIHTMVWAEDVRICGPTVSAALQSDEYAVKDGAISKTASAVASLASSLSNVPLIGPYAKATEIGASALANVASAYGYTDPPVLNDVMPFKDVPFHGMSSTDISVPMEKLSLDSKNELTIDPRTTGINGDDEMSISNIVQRESYLGTSIWSDALTPGNIIFVGRVHPNYYAVTGTPGTNGAMYSLLPTAYVQNIFKYWRGDLIFRFRFVVSQFHRGRVRISWDPNANLNTNGATLTTNFTRIVDLAEETDVSIKITYSQASAWLKTQRDWSGSTNYSLTGGTITSHVEGEDNGMFNIRVFTQLSTPKASSNAYIMVSVRGGDNLEFANPTELPENFSHFIPQSDYGSYESFPSPQFVKKNPCWKRTARRLTGGCTCRYDCDVNDHLCYTCYKRKTLKCTLQASEGTTEEIFTGTPASSPQDHLVYMGERVVSFRQLLRRSVIARYDSFPVSTGKALIKLTQGRFPLQYGFDPNGVDLIQGLITTGANFAGNCNYPILYNYLAPSYVGNRGSTNWQFNLVGTSNVGHWSCQRAPFSTRTQANYDSVVDLTTPFATLQRNLALNVLPGQTGRSLQNQNTQTGLAVQAPLYSRFRFLGNQAAKSTLGDADFDETNDSLEITAILQQDTTDGQAPENVVVERIFAIGTDFTFFWFLNVPTMYYMTGFPARIS